MPEPRFTLARSLILSAGTPACVEAGWCANRLTPGKCASKISTQLTARGRSTWPTRSGSQPIRTITLRTSREYRGKVELCCKGLSDAAGADPTCYYATKDEPVIDPPTFATVRCGNTGAQNVSVSRVQP